MTLTRDKRLTDTENRESKSSALCKRYHKSQDIILRGLLRNLFLMQFLESWGLR